MVMAVPALHHMACFAQVWVDVPALAFPSTSSTALRHNVPLSLWDLQRNYLIWAHRQNSFHSNASAWMGQSHYFQFHFYFSTQASPALEEHLI